MYMLMFSITFCMAQNLQDAIRVQQQQQQREQQAAEQQKQAAAEQQQREAQQQRAADEQRKRELELRYQNLIESAEKKFEQQQLEQAKQEYILALEIKPENAASISSKIEEIDMLISQNEAAESELNYQKTIELAQSSFEKRQFTLAMQQFIAARDIKPEEAVFINSKISEIEKIMNEPATLHLYRKRRNLIGFLEPRYDIILENVVVGSTTANWKTTVTVDSFGPKTLTATIDGRKAEIQITFEPGAVHYLRCDLNSKTVDTGKTTTTTDRNGRNTTSKVTEIQHTPIFQIVSKSVGESEFNAIRVR